MTDVVNTLEVPERNRARSRWTSLQLMPTGAPGIHLALVIAGALVATAFGVLGHDSIQHLLLVAITGVTVVRALLLFSARTIPRTALLALIVLPFLFVLSVLASGKLTGNHLYLIFLAAFLVTLELGRPLSLRTLLRITNAYYLVYLALSIMVYLGLIDLGRALNIFDATGRFSGLEFRTLVGFYGSTAHIDAISLFVVLVNLLYGRGKSRNLIIILALAASLGSVRFTPFVALGVAIFGVWHIQRVRKSSAVRRAVAVGFAMALLLSAPLAVVAVEVIPSVRLEQAVNLATNGRLRIWQDMHKIFANAPALNQWFGTGSTDPYYAVGGWPRVHPTTKEVAPFWTTNPHNSYLAVALNHGVAALAVLGLAIAYLISQMRTGRSQLLTLYLLAVGITNAELLTFYFPIYVVWLLWIRRPQVASRSVLASVKDFDRFVIRSR